MSVPSIKKQTNILFTDNEAIVEVWTSGSSKNEHIMSLVRELFFIAAKYNFNITLRHIQGKYNVFADLLSRLQVAKFKEMCHWAEKDPCDIPQFIWHL